jgi:hypothetical protein
VLCRAKDALAGLASETAQASTTTTRSGPACRLSIRSPPGIGSPTALDGQRLDP